MTVAGTGSDSLAARLSTAFGSYRAGDEQAMSVLVEAATPLLWHTARGTGLDAATAEDVVQTTFVRLYTHSDSISDPQAVLQWLLTTARREAWAVSKRERRVDVTDAVESADGVEPQAHASDEIVLRTEEQRVLWDHVRHLSERCQHLLRIIAVADRPDYASIADALGMPVGSIGPTRGRCLAKLRIALLNDPKWLAS
jgi:RNA polymerase sigma factor (sigma-70 family)